MSLRRAIERIGTAEKGSHVAAFFDYDGTVISGYSAAAFLTHRFRERQFGLSELARTVLAGIRGVRTEDEFKELLALTLQGWRGTPEADLEDLGRKLFKETIAAQLHTEIWDIVQAHRAMGHSIVLASSATRFQVEPMAEALGADHVLSTQLDTDQGILTGAVRGEPLWASGKARAVRALAASEGIDLDRSFAYSNGREDVEFLESVAHPTAVAPDDELRREAGSRGWPVLECRRRGGRADLETMARTAGFYGSFGIAFVAGLGVGLINGRRDQILEVTGGVGADLGLAIAGVDVRVVAGAEHLWSARPCVFVFNHQSNIDPIVVMKLLRGGFTGVAKKEARSIPGFGQFFQIAGVAFVERGNTEQAKEALAPAVAKLRTGTSLAMSPEGTRSSTPRLGRFKKGAFHIAMQAEVPIVPIVIRGAGAVMSRGRSSISRGDIEIAVLPPVSVEGWAVADLDEHVSAVRDMFVDTLANWPGCSAGAVDG